MKKKLSSEIIKIYPWKGFVLNALSALYFYSMAPVIEGVSLEKFSGAKTYFPIFGLLLMAMSALEFYAFPRKMKLVNKLLRDNGEKAETGTAILWVAHLSINMIVLMIILSSFGYDISDSETQTPFWVSIIILILFLKEIYFFMIILVDEIVPKKVYHKLKSKELIYDIILVVYSWIAFSVLWTGISKVGDTDMHSENTTMFVMNIVIVSFFFLIMYLSIRIPHILEESTLAKTNEQYFRFIFSILLILVAVVSRI